jgi:hypothetical protein
MLYFAYGSNLHLDSMAGRCPDAKPLGKFYLGDARLVFRGVADCLYEKGSRCPGGLWRITPKCEAALDRYEGVGSGFYRKVYAPLAEEIDGENEVMLYVMNSSGIYPPSKGYLDCLIRGYKDFKLPKRPLMAAVRDAFERKNPTHVERQRLRRHGNPPLARMPSPEAAGLKTGSPKTGNLFGFQEESA